MVNRQYYIFLQLFFYIRTYIFQAREELEVSKEETLQKYKALQAEMEKYKHDLDEARRTIEDLQKQLLETTVSCNFKILISIFFWFFL